LVTNSPILVGVPTRTDGEDPVPEPHPTPSFAAHGAIQSADEP
jgi:hypothetical protein